jgi:hypothetical protein
VKDVGLFAHRLILDLALQDRYGNFIPIPFRVDSGSDFTMIPISLANKYDIIFDSNHPVVIPHTAAGKASRPSFRFPLSFKFPNLPRFQFTSECLFNPDIRDRGLLSLNDIVPHFFVRSQRAAQPRYPFGFVAFQLRSDHRGQPCP